MEILFIGLAVMFGFIGFGLFIYCVGRARDGEKLW